MEQTVKQITPGNYREYDAINYSLLKRLNEHPSKVDEEIEPNEGMISGDMIDLLAFTPEKFEEKYYVSDLTDEDFPSDNVQKIVHLIIDEYSIDGFTDENMLWAAEIVDWGQSWNDSTITKKIMEQGAEYARMVDASRGKTVISEDKHQQAKHAVSILQSHGWTAKYFNRQYLEDHQQLFWQVPMTGPNPKHEDVLHKSLLDIVLIDRQEKIVYPWDLKFTGRFPENFTYDFVGRGYYLQAASYWWVLYSNIAGMPGAQLHIDADIEGYDVAPFGFIVTGDSMPELPLRFKTTMEDILMGIWGGTTKRGKELEGFVKLTEDLLWHREHNLWDYRRETYEAEGELQLGIREESNVSYGESLNTTTETAG